MRDLTSEIKWMQREATTDNMVLEEKDIKSVLEGRREEVTPEVADYVEDLNKEWVDEAV